MRNVRKVQTNKSASKVGLCLRGGRQTYKKVHNMRAYPAHAPGSFSQTSRACTNSWPRRPARAPARASPRRVVSSTAPNTCRSASVRRDPAGTTPRKTRLRGGHTPKNGSLQTRKITGHAETEPTRYGLIQTTNSQNSGVGYCQSTRVILKARKKKQ